MAIVDTDRFERYLAAQLEPSTSVAVTAVETISGGYNSSMTKVTADVDGEPRHYTVRSDLPLDRTLVPVDRHQEWAFLTHVSEHLSGTACPPLVGFDPDGRSLGQPSIVLEYVRGTPLQALATAAPSGERHELTHTLIDTMAHVHQCDVSRLPPSVERPSSWQQYVADLAQDWRDAEAEYVEPDPFIRFTAAWLERHRPPEAPMTLVHGDFQTSNVLIGENGNTTVVDWEFAHIGDPREDLGWLQVMERLSPPVLYGTDPTAACAHYRERTGLDEAKVNPDTINYFAILALCRPVRSVMQQTKSFVDGVNRSLVMPYVMPMLAASRLQAFDDMIRLSTSPHLNHGIHA